MHQSEKNIYIELEKYTQFQYLNREFPESIKFQRNKKNRCKLDHKKMRYEQF